MINIIMMMASAFLIGEVENGVMHKDCIYEYMGTRYTITIESYKMCPISIKV